MIVLRATLAGGMYFEFLETSTLSSSCNFPCCFLYSRLVMKLSFGSRKYSAQISFHIGSEGLNMCSEYIVCGDISMSFISERLNIHASTARFSRRYRLFKLIPLYITEVTKPIRTRVSSAFFFCNKLVTPPKKSTVKIGTA